MKINTSFQYLSVSCLGALMMLLSVAPVQAAAQLSCHPLSVETCALPFPSDYYTVSDVSSPTGLRTQYSESLFRPEVIDQLPKARGFSIDSLINGDSGFSSNSPVVFELPGKIDSASVPRNGELSVVAINVNTGERQLVRSVVNGYAEYSVFVKSSDVIEVSPRRRWNFGEKYVVAITSQVKQDNGSDFAPLADFPAVAAGTAADAKFFSSQQDGLLALQNAGVDLSDVITASVFTVRDKDEVVQPMLKTAKIVYQGNHPVRDLKVKYKWYGQVAAFLTGEVRIDNYREANTGLVDFNKTPTEQWVTFIMFMPRLARGEKAPVAIYGHPIAGVKEMSVNAISNAKMGMATIGINFPNHGERIFQDGGYTILNVGSSSRLPAQVGMLTQPTLDFMALLKAIETQLNGLDLMPKTWWTSNNTIHGLNGDGVPDLDLDRITVQGSSLGGVLGASFASIAPNIKGAYFHVSGVGIVNLLADSILWDFLFATLVPWGSTGAEGVLLRAMLQQEIDYGDGANFIDYAKYPLEGNKVRPLAVLTGAGDQVVPNDSTTVMANILDIPIVGEKFYDMQGVRQVDDFEEGFGIFQEALPQTQIGLIDGGLAHIFPVITPRAWSAQEEWIKKYIIQ